MSEERLLSLRKVRGERYEMDSLKAAKQKGDRRAFDVLYLAQSYWNNMDAFRRDRERNKRYVYGDQWGDLVHVDGKVMTEGEYIAMQGSVPLKNNHLRKLVRSLVGVYRGQSKEPTCTARDRDEQGLGETMSTVLQYNMQLNQMAEMYARTFEDFSIGGFIVHRKSFGWRNDKLDCWTDYVSPNNFFIDNNIRDFRGWDVQMLGEVHDISMNELLAAFAKGPTDYQRLREAYRYAHDRDYLMTYSERFGRSRLENYDFLFTDEPGRCRVIEVWQRETKPRYRCHDWNTGELYKIEIKDYKRLVEDVNTHRLAQGKSVGMSEDDIPLIEATWFVDSYWYYYYLTPFGEILDEGETPYAHKSHPYVFKAYPFIDGEIHSFIGDVIDQQRYTNRLITMYDWIMRSSAKGVLLFPEDLLPDDMTMDDIADEWSRFNGVIAFKSKAGVSLPTQIATNCTNIGISELLNLQIKFFEDISGVSGALQGKPGFAGMSASLYNQQTQNATTSLLDILETFSAFIVDAAYKDVKNIQQFYDDKRMVSIAGKKAVEYDPDRIKDIEFDLSVTESTITPVYRQMVNDLLMELFKMQAITVEQMLENSSLPFADDLLQSIRAQQERAAQGQQPQGLPEGLQQQVQQGANMQAVNQAYQALRGGQAEA